MNKIPNYKRATNAAYEVLKCYNGPYPQIDIMGLIVVHFPNIKVHTYSDMAKKFNMSLSAYLDTVMSDQGYVSYNYVNGKGNIFYNDTKCEQTIRFTLAHELGHIILGHRDDDNTSRCEADCFARNLLCPVPLRDGFNLSTVEGYCECFNISEPMAKITLNLNTNDNYYIAKDNYNDLSDKVYCYFTGQTLAELYGY